MPTPLTDHHAALLLADLINGACLVIEHAQAIDPDHPAVAATQHDIDTVYLPTFREVAGVADATTDRVRSWLADHVEELDALNEELSKEGRG